MFVVFVFLGAFEMHGNYKKTMSFLVCGLRFLVFDKGCYGRALDLVCFVRFCKQTGQQADIDCYVSGFSHVLSNR